MTAADIKHFLVIYDAAAGHANLRHFGTDYEKALLAYDEAEGEAGSQSGVDVVLLSADSLETIKGTHSSYFETKSLDELLPA